MSNYRWSYINKLTHLYIYRAPSVSEHAQVLELYAPGSLRETVGAWARNLSPMWGRGCAAKDLRLSIAMGIPEKNRKCMVYFRENPKQKWITRGTPWLWKPPFGHLTLGILGFQWTYWISKSILIGAPYPSLVNIILTHTAAGVIPQG